MRDYLHLLTSPEGEKMRAMVTEGFYDKSPLGTSLFQVLGLEWDEMAFWSSSLSSEIFPQTCSWSIGFWEDLLGIFSDETLSLETRRQQLLLKEQFRAPINPESIRLGVMALTGATLVEVEDFVGAYCFRVDIQGLEDDFSGKEAVWRWIQDRKPSHLRFFLYFTHVEYQSLSLESGGAFSAFVSVSEKGNPWHEIDVNH